MPDFLLNLTDIVAGYPGRPPVLDGLSFALGPAELVGLVGPNGCGKTTLLGVIMGLIKPQSGVVRIFGEVRSEEKSFRPVRPQIGFVFQDANDQLFCPTVADDLAFGPLNLGASRKEADAVAQEVLKTLGLDGFGPRIAYDLSGGEKKLVALGTALALKPKLLILDEPTNFLDVEAVARLEAVLKKLNLPGVIVSHDLPFLDRMVTKRYRLTKGRLRPD
ncbi:MAG: energy-coupling factor ABC transporter ATP-binding protein [Deltaproteobacteria bacterium]|jgi:cobalt/nickel transport system ATP-binding protein|nr:energy-coupling factor ABC transporter ATP-binding protein [Deltaproteobacteria bacterium]